MGASLDLTGKRFGNLTVVEKLPERQDRYFVWLCKCDCGNLIKVNTKRLNRGTIQGCPDCWKSRVRKPADLTGRRFGRLRVTGLVSDAAGEKRMWDCTCDCGNSIQVSTKSLLSGKRKSCGCLSKDTRRTNYVDLCGRQIGWLKVVEKLDERDYKGSVMWRCKCKCGNECVYSEDSLTHGVVSCGCYRRTFSTQNLNNGLHRVEGTCIEHLRRRIRSDNTSGHTGVYQKHNGKFIAAITFKGKRYHLGVFETKEQAIKARLKAEEMHLNFIEEWSKKNGKENST